MKWFKSHTPVENNTYPVNDEIEEIKKSIALIVEKSIKETLKEVAGLTEDISSLRLQIDQLNKEKRKLSDDILTATKTKELEQLETEHLVKLKEERMKLNSDKKEIELEKAYQQKELNLRNEHFTKTLETIKEQQKDTKELYQTIMKVLPNVNVDIIKNTTTPNRKVSK